MAQKMNATKAWFAGATATVLAFLGGLAVALEDATVTGNEWVTIAILTVTALGGVGGATYAAPANKPVDKFEPTLFD